MACVPVGALVAAVLTRDLMSDPTWSIEFADSARKAAARFDVPLFGGDVATHSGDEGVFVASATVLAVPDAVAGGRVVTRSGASPGDDLYVTGCFGRSLAADGTGHHEGFVPRIESALSLHRTLGPALTSMIDVSDGLAADAGHLAAESEVLISIDTGMVPRRGNADVAAAMSDGEDYELCFTVAPGSVPPDRIDDVPVTRIGRVDQGRGIIVLDGGREVTLDRPGWEHEE